MRKFIQPDLPGAEDRSYEYAIGTTEGWDAAHPTTELLAEGPAGLQELQVLIRFEPENLEIDPEPELSGHRHP